ncbi:serine hydrolase domain-containing protein [Paenibacillus cremeus]|nr:serine hydrolase [Paenibacillus cremeus]
MTTAALPRSKVKDQSRVALSVESFLEAVRREELNLQSFMLLHHGEVAAETWWPPYQPNDQYHVFSLSKSFCSTAVGLAAQEGLLSVDDLVLDYFPSYRTPDIERNMGELRIRHLLTMSTGHTQDPTGAIRNAADGDWVRAFFESPIEAAPGSLFVYNSGATYMLSAIVQAVTGQTTLEYLQPRLLKPLGIEQATWEMCPRGINTGGWGLRVTTEDIAKFGLLYLRKGLWQGQRLISEAWIEAATVAHIPTPTENGIDKRQGYGYQFWRCQPNGVYCGRGMKGQFCIVLPEQDAVIAITSDENRMQLILDQVWEHLLPAL